MVLWAIAWPVTVYAALRSPWAAPGDLPSLAQTSEARARVLIAGWTGIALPAIGLVLAGWCRRESAVVWTGGCVALAVILTGILRGLMT